MKEQHKWLENTTWKQYMKIVHENNIWKYYVEKKLDKNLGKYLTQEGNYVLTNQTGW